ncbi:MAG: hypothetical protein K8T89_11955 [Planctomycetes bacterium]|nr:hypothetical protein [Planctomycetota bacterium]
MIPLLSPSATPYELRERIQQIEASTPRAEARRILSTGVDALDRLLPGGGLSEGSLIEWWGDSEGCGAATLALVVASHVLRQESVFAVIDDTGEFYLPAAAQRGIPLDRTVVVRPDSSISTVWAWEQALRCSGVGVTFGRLDSLNDRLLRRLQLGVETGGGLGFLVRRPGCESAASWGVMRLRVQSSPGQHPRSAWRLRVSLLRGRRESSVELELDHETRDVPVVSGMAAATTLRGPSSG